MSNGGLGKLVADLGKALIGGLASSKPPDEGCNVCPNANKATHMRRPRRPGLRRAPVKGSWRKR